MKAISIKQPWASLIASGVKTLELRNWPTDHRGELLICSSRRPVIDGHQHGTALCVAEVVGCRPMTPDDVPFACVPRFLPGHYAWELKNIRLIKPFPVVGQLRLFDVPNQLIAPADDSPNAAGRNTGDLFTPARRTIGKP